MKHCIRLLLLPLLLLALALAGCAGGKNTTANPADGATGSSGSNSGSATHLIAKAETVVNGSSVELHGDFLNDTAAMAQQLKGDLEDAGLAAGTSVSFCLLQGSTEVPLAVGATGADDETEIEDADEVQFHLDSANQQTVPAVNAGDTLEAHSGATAEGSPDCTATLLISAKFQAVPANEDQETELNAETESQDSMGAQLKLRGDFQSEFDRTRLRGRFEDSGMSSSTTISFCLVTGEGSSTGLAVSTIGSDMDPEDHEGRAQFVLDSQKGDTVPAVVAGNSIEAHSGANTDGTPACDAASLLASATFQPKDDGNDGNDGGGGTDH